MSEKTATALQVAILDTILAHERKVSAHEVVAVLLEIAGALMRRLARRK